MRYSTKDTDLATYLNSEAPRFKLLGAAVEKRNGRDIVVYQFEMVDGTDMPETARAFHEGSLRVEPRKLLISRAEIHKTLHKALRENQAGA